MDAEHFEDPLFLAWVRENADTNGSGWLSAEEIEAVEEIELKGTSYAGLTSLRGIECFQMISYLGIEGTPLLTSLDLSGNEELVHLNLYRTGVTSLDVSSLTLTMLSCDSMPLETLILGGQPGLEILSCYDTSLTAIDISGCPRLVEAFYGAGYSDSTCDSYSYGSYELYVNVGAAVITGFPEPVFFLPAGLTAIGDEAFSGIPAEAVVITESVDSIAGDPFQDSAVRYIFGLRGSQAEVFTGTHPAYTFVPVTGEWMADQ